MERMFNKSDVVINKVRRVPVVVFMKRNFPVIVFLIVLSISFLLGLWNVKNFEYLNSKLDNVSIKEIDSYLSIYLGRNIFSLRPNDVTDTIIHSNGFVKKVTIKKVLPSTLSISIDEFPPVYMGYSSNSCLLFANTGELIKEICKECEQECKKESETNEMIYISSNSVIESNDKLIFFEEIFKITTLLEEFNYSISSLTIEDGICTFKDTLQHTFIFDLTNQLDVQLARMYLVGTKINKDMIQYTTLDLRFDRPVMNIK